MSDQQNYEQQPLLPTMDERVDREVALIFGRHELVTQEGRVDVVGIADLIYPTIKAAVVEAPGERTAIGVTPTRLMEQFFPDVPGPAAWAEHDEEEAEFQARVYDRVKKHVFRVLNVYPDGLVQARLAANGGLVLCRTPKKGGREEMAYVTRNRKCIEEDNNSPAITNAKKYMDRAAALSVMAVDRVPEDGKYFANLYNRGMREGIDAGKNKIKAALEAGGGLDADDE